MDDYNPQSLSTVDAFDAVASELRQAVLNALLSADCAGTNVESLTQVVADELTTTENTTTTDSPETLKLRLVHHHLPRLDDDDLVEFNHEACTVECGDDIGDIKPLL